MTRSHTLMALGATATAVLAAAACLGNDPVADPAGGLDAGPPPTEASPIEEARAPDDAGADATSPGCDPDAPFEPPSSAIFANINSANSEDRPYLSADELTVYFARMSREGEIEFINIWQATRKSIADVFDAPSQVAGGVNKPAESVEASPVVTADGKKMFFTRSVPQATYDIWVSERPSATEPWGLAAKIPSVSGPKVDLPSDFLDGVLWLATNEQVSAKYGIFRALPADGGFAAPVVVTGLEEDALTPRITRDGKRLFFAKLVGNLFDIWTAAVDAEGKLLGEPSPVDNVNSAGNDQPGSISDDGCRMYLSSDRTRPAGYYDLHVAYRRKQ